MYVANANTSLESISALSVGTSGALTNLANSPSSLGILPTALAINPAGTLLWVGSEFQDMYVYVINSDGSLTLGNSKGALGLQISVTSMVVDPSGNYLLVLSSTGTGTAPAVYVYSINKTNGVLTAVTEGGNAFVGLDNGTATQIAFAPNGTQVYVGLGTGGVDALSFSASNGGLSKLNVLLQPKGNGYADNALAIDPGSKYLFVGETGTLGVRAFTINTNGSLTEVAGSPFVTNLGISSMLVDKTGTYLYAANNTASSISAFGIGSAGVLTQIAGSPFATGSSPYSLAEDNSGTYLLSANLGGGPDVQAFTITPAAGTTPGALVSAATASTGGTVSPAGAISVVAAY